MSATWREGNEPDPTPLGLGGWLRVVLRGVPLAAVVFGGLAILLLVRLLERPLYSPNRPWTPWITQTVCRLSLWILGIRLNVVGRPMETPGCFVANHASWLDIFSLNAPTRLYFVSKAEVAGWPGIGWLARATGTVFLRRERRDAKAQTELFQRRLSSGHQLLFFPEGTSTDGQRILPFKSTLFGAFFNPDFPEDLAVQPVTLIYHAPAGEDARFYGWWGDMEFGPHILKTLGARRQGKIELIYHQPLRVQDFADRKLLALASEKAVRQGAETGQVAKMSDALGHHAG